jgi:hypothetical protein
MASTTVTISADTNPADLMGNRWVDPTGNTFDVLTEGSHYDMFGYQGIMLGAQSVQSAPYVSYLYVGCVLYGTVLRMVDRP